MRKLVLLAVMGLLTFVSHAQTATVKVGYADVDYIFSQMPEPKQIDAGAQIAPNSAQKSN